MVLENSSSDEDASRSFHDYAPTSDSDPYAHSTGPHTYTIDMKKLQAPIPVIGTLMGFTGEFYARVIDSRIRTHEMLVKRRLTQDEVDAVSFWAAKQISVSSYGSPIGLVAGLYRASKTMEEFRFPFYKPTNFNATVFPSATLALLRGPRAVAMWHLLRHATYGAMGVFAGSMIFGSYSFSVAAVGELKDGRLAPSLQAAQELSKQQRRSPRRPEVGGSTHGSRQPARQHEGPVDDASPTAGWAAGEDNANIRSPERPRGQILSTQQTQSTSEGFDPLDLSLPDREPGREASTPSSQPQYQSGSAWERLRQKAGRGSGEARQNMETAQQSQRPRQQQSRGWAGLREQAADGEVTTGDYTFSESVENRNTARAEAQKEFDARLERERRGGDFSDDRGFQRRM